MGERLDSRIKLKSPIKEEQQKATVGQQLTVSAEFGSQCLFVIIIGFYYMVFMMGMEL